MARSQGTNRRKYSNRRDDAREERHLQEGTRHGIIVVILFVCAGISLLSFFGLAGPFGTQVEHVEGAIVGWLRFIIPVAFVAYGGALLMRKEGVLSGMTTLGIVLLVLSIAGLFHLFYVDNDDALMLAAKGIGGGYIGYAVAWPLVSITGVIAACIILLALLIIGVLITFNTTLFHIANGANVASPLRRLFTLFKFERGQSGVSGDYSETRAEETEFTARNLSSPVSVQAGSSDEDEEDADDQTDPAQRGESDEEGDDAEFAIPKTPKRKIAVDLPLSLLDNSSTKPTSGDVKSNMARIQKALANFNIQVEMGEVSIGPTVTQYTLRPADGVKLSQIVNLSNDLALALAAHPIRIEAPIPGKSLVGVEVPNETVAKVSLKDVLDSEQFAKRKSNLALTLGKDVSGMPIVANLESMPHLLIAGATGSGKSVSMKSLIISLLYQNQPSDLKFIMVDPKRVELSIFNDIPHLITPVITEVSKTVNALKWAVAEMDRRYQMLSEAGARDIRSYNAIAGDNQIPFIIVVIDELADLMASSAREVEGMIVRLAQMARAVGIHLIVATQRPSVDVITGLIKANITSRIAFSVASLIDSRTIIDGPGAEKLLGNGDMLFVSGDLKTPRRIQGAFITDEEIRRVVSHLKKQAAPDYQEGVTQKVQGAMGGGVAGGEEEDEMYEEAKAVVVQAGKASASLLQRRLRLGYARAARLLDMMEENGVIGPLDGARPREVLMQPGDADYSDIPVPDRADNTAYNAEEENI